MANRIAHAGPARKTHDHDSLLDGALATAATRVQDTLSELGSSAAEGLRATREVAATKLDGTADGLRDTADRVSELGYDAADRVLATARYIRKRKVSVMLSDLEGAVRAHPRKSVLAAAMGGFLIARVLRVGRRKA